MNLIKRFTYLPLISLLFACSYQPAKEPVKEVKNVIMMIGDGMGPQQVGLLLSYARQAPNSVIKNRITAFDRILEKGRLSISLTHSEGTLVTDSAASATQLATGHAAGSEMIGLNRYGERQQNIIDKAKQRHKATGLVSDTRITHATPAAFAAHQTHRHMESEIAEDLLNSEPDVMLSAGLSYWLPLSVNKTDAIERSRYEAITGLTTSLYSKRKDNKDLLKIASEKGYQLAFNRQQLSVAKGKTIGLFSNLAMPNGIIETQQKNNPQRTQPTLKEMSAQALDILQTNENGFFLMIEAGQIDWAGHSNDTGLLLHEMLRINETLNYVLDWLEAHPDTLLIVTADHETGGFGFSYSAANPSSSNYIINSSIDQKQLFPPQFNFGNPKILDGLYQQKFSYADIFAQFDVLPAAEKKAIKLAELVNKNTEFTITETQAREILQTEPNALYNPDYAMTNQKTVSKIPVNGAFFPYQSKNRENLLAQAVAVKQQAV